MNVATLFKLPQTVKNIKRIRTILNVLIRHGFGDIVARLNIDSAAATLKRVVLFQKERTELQRFPIEARVRMVLEELGPTFIKLGQIMATRPDIIPMSLILELRRLQDDVPSFPYEIVRETLESELGRPFDEVYAQFDETPLAAASIAQVHRATLKDGSRVAVKVRRPNLEEIVSTDLSILQAFAALIEERIPESRQFQPKGMVEQFSRALSKEIDLTNEAYYLTRYAKNFEGKPYAHIPTVYREISSRRVLVMEFIEGVKIDNLAELDARGIDREQVARQGTRIVLESIFEHGFFHADPHPGNIFVRADGTICLIDFGMIGTIEPQRLDELLTFLVAILINDTAMMCDLFLEMGLVTEEVDLRQLGEEVKQIIDRYYSLPLAEIDIAEFITRVFDVIMRHHVQIPADLMLVAKAITTVEGIAQQVYPQYDPLKELRPYLISHYLRRSLDPLKASRQAYEFVSSYLQLARQLPKDLRALLRKLRAGEFRMKLDVPALEADSEMRERGENRRMLLALGTLLLAASIAVTSLPGPLHSTLLFGAKLSLILAVTGFATSALVFVVLILALLRSGRI